MSPAIAPAEIPLDLRGGRFSVVWKLAERPGNKPAKQPYDAVTGLRARVNDPASWATFEAAVDAYDTVPYDGIGRVLVPDQGLAAIDLDDAVDAGGRVTAWAVEIVNHLRSYTELSPSRRGLHVWTRGTLPPGGRRRGPLELYDRGRYLTLTGWRLDGTPAAIALRQRQINDLHARVFASLPHPVSPVSQSRAVEKPEKAGHTGVVGFRLAAQLDDGGLLARAAHACQGHGRHFVELWGGGLAGHDTPSEADLALVSRLAFWCNGDRTRIDRLFRASGRLRDKWDRPCAADGRTYGQVTIAYAVRTMMTEAAR